MGFLDVFGGTFLISEVPLRAMLSPSLAIAGVIALLILFGAVRLRDAEHAKILHSVYYKMGVAIVLAGVIALAVEGMARVRLLVEARAVLVGFGSIAAVIFGVTLAEAAVLAWQRQARLWRLAALAAASVLFIVFPFLSGRAAALESAWNPDRELPRIFVQQKVPAYLLFANDQYLFCVGARQNRDSGWTKIGPFKSYAPSHSIDLTPPPRMLCLRWSDVKQMSGTSHYTTDRDGGLW